MTADPRKAFIIDRIFAQLGVYERGGQFASGRNDLEASFLRSADLSRFVDDASFKTLQAYSHKNSMDLLEITLSLEVVAGVPGGSADISSPSNAYEQEIHFIKKHDGVLPLEDVERNLIVTSFVDAWLALKHVFGAKFLSGAANNKFSKALVEVEAALHQTALHSNASSAAADALRAVQSISDEHAFWNDAATAAAAGGSGKGGRGGTNTPSSFFARTLGKIAPRFAAIREQSRAEFARLVEDAQDACSALWLGDADDDEFGGALVARASSSATSADSFPEFRMAHLLALIGRQLVWYWADNLSRAHASTSTTSGLLSDALPEVRQSLAAALKTLAQWDSAVADFMKLWPRWQGAKFSDSGLQLLRARLKALLHVRTLQSEVVSLLPSVDERKRIAAALMRPLEQYVAGAVAAGGSTGNPLLQLGAGYEDSWQSAMSAFQTTLSPLEPQLATLLRKRLFSLAERPEMLLAEFRRFPELLCQKRIADELASERESLLGQMFGYLADLRGQYDSRASDFDAQLDEMLEDDNASLTSSNINMSPLTDAVMWLHQVTSKVKQTALVVSRVLPDVPGLDKFQAEAKELEARVADSAKQCFARWTEDSQRRLADPSSALALQTRGALIEFDTVDGQLRVNYSERLVTLMREVRQLSELGYKVPPKIAAAAETGEKFYRHALKLKQVANFYNTASEQIIKSQQGLLISEVDNFEKVVRSQSQAKTAWDSPDECEQFVGRLQEAAERLTARNRRLRAIHLSILQQISKLLQFDLARERARFGELVDTIRATFERETRSVPRPAALMWAVHLDKQLYKVLDFQYRVALQNLRSTMPEISADLVFKNRKFEFRPAADQLRRAYYRSLKSVLDYPVTFRGLAAGKSDADGGDSSSVQFHLIPARNASALRQVYASAEQLFSELEQLKSSFAQWGALGGGADVEEYIRSRVHDIDDFECNLTALRVRRRDAERLPDQRRIDCFVISLVPFKASIDDHIQRTHDALLLALRRGVVDEATQLGEFVKSALESLNHKPESVSEMGAAAKAWARIADAKADMERLRASVERKNTLLVSAAGKGVDISNLLQRWDALAQRLGTFQSEMEEDKKRLVDRLQNDASDLNKECTQFTSRWTSLRPKVNISTTGVAELITLEVVERSLVELTTWRKEYDELETRTVQMKEQCSQFAVALPTNLFDTLPVADRELRSSEEIWNFYAEFARAIGKAEAELWINYRAHLYDLEDLVNLFTKKLRARGAADGTKDSASTALVEQMSSRLGELRSIFPSLKLVGGECFEKEHWAFLFHRLKMGSDVSLQTLTLGMFIRAAPLMQQHANALRDLAARAQGEITLREAVAELRAWCDSAEFKCNRDRHGVKQVRLISEWRELLSKVSDQQALLASLRDSPYFAPFKDTAAQFEIKLATLGDALQALNQVQRKWLHLEPIFARGALPQEQPRFRRLDAQFVEIMQGVESNPQVCALLDSPVLASDSNALNTMLDQLERCQKALADFLEEKRTRFSRFFFIGDDDMLEILGQAQKASVIQTHLKKLFAGIDRVHLSKDEKQIEAMVSSDGEVVSLRTPVVITAEVESWLKQLADEMQRSLSHLLIACVKDFDLEKYPSQLLCLAECITFTHQCEQAIQSGQLNALYQALGNRLADLTAFETHGNRVLELKVKALVFDVIHNYDVVRQLVAAKVTNLDDWMWHKQLKFRMQNTPAAEQQSGFAAQRCVVLMADAEFAYSYEYLGNTPKLVHTPLTDKCYLVLTQGMHLGYGGNPYGPAGTGKTESVKALGCALGRQVLVFNCDEGIDFQSMGRILTGLVQSGAWGCFDEFNRLKEDQLSAVSQQIQVIQAALKNRDRTCDLLGATIPVNQNAGIFVTMNPAGKEYGGRSRLPDNLKQLFRAVAMSVPDNNLIAEVILYSEGFAHAKTLGHKLVSIFSLSKQLLSPQRHYDWGLRALKTVLGAGGSLIHAERKKLAVNKESAALTVATETHLLVQALNVNTLSKLTYADALRFQALVLDVFPGLQWKDMETANLDAALLSTLEARQLQSVGPQMHKMRQLYEALNQRMGCVIVGPSGCGKSTLLSVLYDALTQKMGQRIVKFVLNPKALDRNRLLGRMDPDTREWFDGVLTAAARGVIREVSADPKVRCWVICDGDIDPEWVEALNSVLDDNRLLTLPNGERIQFNSQVNFIFECHDLQFASPATVSRASMIFLSEEGVDVESLVQAWLDQQASKDEKASRAIALLIQELFYRALAWVKECEPVVPTTLVGTVRTALSHLTDLKVVAHARPAFVLALARGLGSNLQADKRLQLARELVSWAKITAPTALLDCSWDAEIGSLVPYAFIEPVLEYGDLSLLHPPLVQTVDVQRHRDMISTWLRDGEPMLLVGPEGCGKTQLLLHCFSRLKSTAVATVHCSAQTTASHVQAKLLDACGVFTTNLGRVLRPKEGDRLVLYLKDLNLPKPDKYDTSQLISFLQQLITHRGFYNDDLEWLTIERVQIVAQMNGVPSVGRHSLSTRLTSIVRIASINYSDKIQLGAVYTCYLRSILSHAKCSAAQWSDAAQIKRLAACMVDVYEQLQSKFPVDDNTKHLLLTPRELTSWAFGLLRYDLRRHDPLTAVSYELMRLFADRLADSEGRRRVFQMLSAQLQKEFKFVPKLEGVYFSAIAHTLGVGDASAAAVAPSGKTSKKPAITDIDSDGVDADTHPEIGPMLAGCTHDEYHELVERALVAYEREVRVLNVHICAQVLDHAAGVERVLSRPGGSLLLVGDSGVGRRSTAALVAHMLRCRFASPTMSRLYELKHFRNDLKDYIRYAGVEGQPIVLFVEDHHLIQPAFLECVNSLLAAAELPGLFTAQEIDAMLAPLKERFAQNPRGARSLYAFFVDRVRSNLHCVLSFDATNAHMARRIDANPAVSTRCTLMWFGRWAPATVLQLTRARLPAVLNLLEQGGNEALNNVDVDALLRRISYVHDSCVAHGATPRRLVAFLDTIARLFDVKLAAQKQSINHLSAGLGKLKEAEEQVRSLQDEAGKQQVALAAKQRIQEEQMTQITQKIGKAQERRREVDELKKASSAEEAVAQKQKEAVEAELLDVNPILEAARQSVGEIRKDSLAEIKALRMPSPVIQDVITAVFLLLGQEDLSWNTMKSFLSSQSMKEQILHFDARAITPRLRAAVQDHMAKKPDSFDEKKVARVNVSVAPLAVWCVANVKYSIVLEKIAPLTDQLAVVEQSLAGSRAKEAAANAEAKALDDEVQALQKSFTKTTAEAEVLRQKFEAAERTLEAANGLLGKLSGEKARWDGQVVELRSSLKLLPIQVLLASAFVCYAGEHAEDRRRAMFADWCAACDVNSSEFDMLRFLSSESQMLQWKSTGLPADQLSLENAVIMEQIGNQGPVPFVIDPGLRATSWLQKHFITIEAPSKGSDKSAATVETVAHQDSRFVTVLELAVRFGKSLIVTECDHIDALLMPLLRRDSVVQGPRRMVPLGDKLVDFAAGFRLILATRSPSPDLPPDAAALLTEVNFTVTASGLEAQLLGVTLAHENPELEGRKSALLRDEEELRVQLARLEKELLTQLATSQGNILENAPLISSLDQIKSESTNVAQKIANSKQVQAAVDEQREVYRPIANSGSAIFFLIDSLRAVNHMYRFSLPAFLHLFTQNLRRPREGQLKTDALIQLLTRDLTTAVFGYVSRSLFKADRLMFAMHFAHQLRADLFGEHEWEFLLGELVDTHIDSSSGAAALPSWAAPDRASLFKSFATHFPQLVQAGRLQDTAWRAWAENPQCEVSAEFPPFAQQSMTAFQRLLLVQVLRPDRLASAMAAFAAEALQLSSLAPPPLVLQSLYERESAPSEPLLFVITPGADPSAELEELAMSVVGKAGFVQLAMGGGQTVRALQALKECARDGHWLLLQNVHLVTPWLYTLEKELNALTGQGNGIHARFRIWLTSEAHDNFPPALLQQSLKLTYESPPGLRENLLRTVSAWTPALLQGSGASAQSNLRAQMLFVLAWFHAVVQERRTFIPQGWTKFYEFSTSDFRAATDVVSAMCAKAAKGQALPWPTLRGLLEHALYGGRLDNDNDVRVLQTYLQQMFSVDVLPGDDDKSNARALCKGLVVPSSRRLEDYVGLASALPQRDAPASFGLPANIEGSAQRATAAALVAQLKKLAALSSLSSRFDREQWRRTLSPLLSVWSSLTSAQGGALTAAPARFAKSGDNPTPIDSFVQLELQRAHALVSLIDNSIAALNRTVNGGALLTQAVQADALPLLAGNVPWNWEKEWGSGPEIAAAYLREVAVRRLALAAWQSRVESGSLLQSPIRLADLFNPATFLNAFLQHTARCSNEAIDALKLVCALDRAAMPSEAKIVLQLDGLLLQGCAFVQGRLGPLEASSPVLTTIPQIFVAWVPKTVRDSYAEAESVSIPLYPTLRREKTVCDLRLPCANGAQAAWVLSGAALFLTDIM